MKSNLQFVHGGGWLTHQTVGRPRARLFGFLSLIWLGVSVCTSFPFWNGWPQSFEFWEWLGSTLLLPLPLLVGFALVFLLTEQPRTITGQHPNPDYNLRKLY